MRIYNPSIGKFLSVDPLFKGYPWYTPYQFAGNKPINCIDLDGLEELDVKDAKIKEYITNDSRNAGKYQYNAFAFNDNSLITKGIYYEFQTSKGNFLGVYHATHILMKETVLETVYRPVKVCGIIFGYIEEQQEKVVENWVKLSGQKMISTDPDYTLYSNCYSTAFNLNFGVVNYGYDQLLKDNYHLVNNSKNATVGVLFVGNESSHAFRVKIDPITKKEKYRSSTPGSGEGELIYDNWDEFSDYLYNTNMHII